MPENLVKLYGNVYCTRDHDSLKISNGKWMWWSRKFGGSTALDYLIKVRGLSFMNAMEELIGGGTTGSSFFNASNQPVSEARQNRRLLLPERNDNAKVITGYLSRRGIARNIIETLLDTELIYESRHYHNCLLISMHYPQASLVAGYRSWQKNYERHVKPGEKAIKILAPCKYKIEVDDSELNEKDMEHYVKPSCIMESSV